MLLAISRIRTDGGTQPRKGLSLDVIATYGSAMKEGARFPPVDVFYDGAEYWLADGFHRMDAARVVADLDQIECTIHQGTREDAQWFSFGANQTNGHYRSNEDKQRAVKAALVHSSGVGLSDSAIARHVGTDQKTVAAWRAKLELSSEIPKMETRTVTRNGKTYEQKTANIGRKSEAATLATRSDSPEKKKSGGRKSADAELERFVVNVSMIRGACKNFPRYDMELLAEKLSADQFREWARIAESSALRLRAFSRLLRRASDAKAA